jgi:hypothetical protein
VLSVQLSHDELLLLLGILQLPMPMALGEHPMVGYTPQTLNTAMTSAVGSLTARGLLAPPNGVSTRPQLESGLQEIVISLAQADSCLGVIAVLNSSGYEKYYTVNGAEVVAHTKPYERVHRLERLASTETIIEQLIAMIEPHQPSSTPVSFLVSVEVLNTALDAAAEGDLHTAHAKLAAAGLPSTVADIFVRQLGGEFARYAVAAFRGLQNAEPIAQTAAVIHGSQETWYVEEPSSHTGSLQVQTISPDVLRVRLAAMVQDMRSGKSGRH